MLGLVVRVGLLAGWLVVLNWGGFAPVVVDGWGLVCAVGADVYVGDYLEGVLKFLEKYFRSHKL